MHVFLRLAALGAMALPGGASWAVDLLPRIGVQAGYYAVDAAQYSQMATLGPTAGMTIAGERLIGDLNLEALPVDVAQSPTTMARGWRTELSGTFGVRIIEGVVLIAGYRTSRYGRNFASSNLGDNSGPFIGINLPELRLASSDRDILSLSIAAQQTTFTDRVRRAEEDSDIGVNIRLGYRRAGSPHSFGVRYQTFGSESYQEYLTTLQYAYVFGSF
jgi:hypothetical protein